MSCSPGPVKWATGKPSPVGTAIIKAEGKALQYVNVVLFFKLVKVKGTNKELVKYWIGLDWKG
tara:strand:- start:98 stop:286 length:189 start_codon:yes stop_codon:yes gene_type:complete